MLGMEKHRKELSQEAQLAMQGVVRLYVRGYNETDPRSYLDPDFVFIEEWVASGFLVRLKGEEGYILTNSHVVRNATSIEIKSILTSDELFKVELVGLVPDLEPDVALLRMSKEEVKRFLKISGRKELPSLKVAFSQKVLRGEDVKVIGYPLGMEEPNVTGGEISNFVSGSDDTTEHMVTDAAINPGNSGGPAVIRGGEVIGINTAMIIPAENISVVTPLSLVEKVLDGLLHKKRTNIIKLGVLLQKNSENNSRYLGMKQAQGILVKRVYKNSTADLLGLKARDVILEINGRALDRHGNVAVPEGDRKRNIYDVVHSCKEGEELILRVFREGEEYILRGRSFHAIYKDFPDRPLIGDCQFLDFAGLVFQDVSEEIVDALASYADVKSEFIYRDFKNGCEAILTHIDHAAGDLGLELGELVFQVNGERVQKLADLQMCLQKALRSSEEFLVIEFASGALACFETRRMQNEIVTIERLGALKGAPVLTS